MRTVELVTRTETVNTPNGETHVLGIVEHNGKEFAAGGGAITDEYVVVYPSKGKAKLWDGSVVGTCQTTARWEYRTPSGHRSWMGSYMESILVTLEDGRRYRGRGFGDGMILRGRRVK